MEGLSITRKLHNEVHDNSRDEIHRTIISVMKMSPEVAWRRAQLASSLRREKKVGGNADGVIDALGLSPEELGEEIRRTK